METITLQHLIALFRKNLILLAAAGMAMAVLAAVATKTVIKKQYEAETKFYINVAESEDLAQNIYYSQIFAQNVIGTYIEILKTDTFYNRLAERLDDQYTTTQLREMMSFSVVNSTEIFKARVVAGSAHAAKEIADASTVAVVETIYVFQKGIKLDVIDPPVLPDAPFSPNLYLYIAAGMIAGVILAAVYVLLRDFLDATIKDDDDLEARYGVVVTKMPDGGAPSNEARARVLVSFPDNEKGIKIVVTSPGQSQGKAETAAGLALALSEQEDAKVLLVGCDDCEEELCSCLEAHVTLEHIRGQKFYGSFRKASVKGHDGLDVLCADPAVFSPQVFFVNGKYTELLQKAAESYEYIVLSLPPVEESVDSLLLAQKCDGVLFSVKGGVTQHASLRKAVAAYAPLALKPLGFAVHEPVRKPPIQIWKRKKRTRVAKRSRGRK